MTINQIDRRTWLEEWGPFALSFMPLLLGIHAAFTSIPTRPLRFDPVIYLMVFMAIVAVMFLMANVWQARAARGIKFFVFVAVCVAAPSFLIPGFTLLAVGRNGLIACVLAAITLIGKYRGYWWLMTPLAKLNGVASIPEETAKRWMAEVAEEELAHRIPEFALDRARVDWAASLTEGVDGASARTAKRPNVLVKLWRFLTDAEDEEVVEERPLSALLSDNSAEPQATAKPAGRFAAWIAEKTQRATVDDETMAAAIVSDSFVDPDDEAEALEPKPRTIWQKVWDFIMENDPEEAQPRPMKLRKVAVKPDGESELKRLSKDEREWIELNEARLRAKL